MTLADCEDHSTLCRRAKSCTGVCSFEYELAGTQVVPGEMGAPAAPGPCSKLLCDGKGKVEVVAAPENPEDDGKDCTLDKCNGRTPTHEPLPFVACYEGGAETRGVGACAEGLQACNSSGEREGPCVGQVVPRDETCLVPSDEDCDGKINEEGAGCFCGDGYASAGEACDDGNDSSIDACTTSCVLAACGDGFVQRVAGEHCDDGNMAGGDACPSDCRHRVISMELGGGHTCVLREDGYVACWGVNGSGALGLGDPFSRGDEPNELGAALPLVDLGEASTHVLVAAGRSHVCALGADGAMKCWGYNGFGQLGLGDVMDRGKSPNHMGGKLPRVDLGASAAAFVAAGHDHTCAMFEGGAVSCWGNNGFGQLGLGGVEHRGDESNEMGAALALVDLGPGKTATALAAGANHTCVVLDSGKIKCWGKNFVGELGLGDRKTRGDGPGEMGSILPEVDVGMGRTASALALGAGHSCALLEGGAVKCWGFNDEGQLGLGISGYVGDDPGEMGETLAEVDLGAGRSAIAIAAGDHHTCALLGGGAAKCWGRNDRGQLGLGDTLPRGDGPGEMGDALPEVELGPSGEIIAIAAGGSFTCALFFDGAIKCWGDNTFGRLGLGDTESRGDEPGEMGALLPFTPLF
jgi:cysteine-rich repeat protein